MRGNSYKGTSGQTSDPDIRSGNLDFLYDRCISSTKWCLRDIFNVFVSFCVAWTCDLWPFDFVSVSCTVLLVSDPYTNFYYPMTIGYW